MRRVGEFAKAKGISRARAYRLVRSGVLPAHQLNDGSFILDEGAMDWEPRVARPLSKSMAWALLRALDGEDLGGLRATERSRIRQHIAAIAGAESPARELAQKVSARAELKEFKAHKNDAVDVRSDGRVRISGVGAPGSRMMAGDVVEGYVDPGDLEDLCNGYLLRERPGGNVRLRVGGLHGVGMAAVAADLADWGRAREVREADRIVHDLLQVAYQVHGVNPG